MNDEYVFLEMLEDLKDKEDKKPDFYKQALTAAKQMFQLKKAFVEAGFTSQEAFELVKYLSAAVQIRKQED